jgi:hypothetical protein
VVALHGRLDETRAVIVATAKERESQVARVKRRMRFGRTGTRGGAGVTRAGVTRDRLPDHLAQFLIIHRG